MTGMQMLKVGWSAWFCVVSLTAPVACAATYHVDSLAGNDRGDGLSPRTAWRSLGRVNAEVFQPGDRILFKAGTRYAGSLEPHGSGRVASGKPMPIVMDRYGEGAAPRIDGEGRHQAGLFMRNVEYWEVNNLEITNLGPDRRPGRTGVHLLADGSGVLRHIKLSRLYVHDVNGDLRKSREGCGIFFESRGGREARFEDLLIEDCQVARTDRNGICQRTRNGTRSTGVVLRRNLLVDIGGDGIKVWGSNGALVEHNILRGGRTRCEDYAAGIWPWDCDDTIIQFNEVSGMKGTRDGQAFDSDYRCRNTLFQYNYSHDNEGGFMLICSPGNSYCEGTVIRYNISQNDGLNSGRVFHFGGGPKDTSIYNNIIYIGPTQDLPLLLFTEWNGGRAENTRFYNNIFYVDGRVTYEWGRSRNCAFEHNVFFGRHQGRPEDAHGSTAHPPLARPGLGGDGLDTLGGYKLSPKTRPLRGKLIPRNGGRDFFGNPVPADRPPCVGVHEVAE